MTDVTNEQIRTEEIRDSEQGRRSSGRQDRTRRADAGLVVASGGGEVHPHWYHNLMAHSDRAAIERHGHAPVAVTAAELAGPARDEAFQKIASVQPRIASTRSKSEREYPVIALSAR